jgi:hypothetical protein
VSLEVPSLERQASAKPTPPIREAAFTTVAKNVRREIILVDPVFLAAAARDRVTLFITTKRSIAQAKWELEEGSFPRLTGRYAGLLRPVISHFVDFHLIFYCL